MPGDKQKINIDNFIRHVEKNDLNSCPAQAPVTPSEAKKQALGCYIFIHLARKKKRKKHSQFNYLYFLI